MEVVKSIRISLTMGELIDSAGQLTKDQLIEKFRVLLDRKEQEINEKIQFNNAEHLLILQKKTLILERKDDQIVKLNNAVASLKNELHEEKSKFSDLQEEALENKFKAIHFEKKYGEFDNIFKEEKAKREKLKKQYEKLQAQFKILSDQNANDMRAYKKVKEEKVNWQQQTELLLNNLKNSNEKEQEEKFRNFQLNFENKIKELTDSLNETKGKYESYKQKYLEAKSNVSNLTKSLELVNKELLNQKLSHSKNYHKPEISVEAQTTNDLQPQNQIEILFQKGIIGKISQKSDSPSLQKFLARKLESPNPQKNSVHVHVPSDNSQKLQQNPVFRQSESPNQQKYPSGGKVLQTLSMDEHDEIEKKSEIPKQCEQCKQLKYKMKNLEYELKKLKSKQKKNEKDSEKPKFQQMESQTDAEPEIYYDEQECQTVFAPMSQEQQKQLICSFQQIIQMHHQMFESQKRKYEEMEQFMLSKPSRIQDRAKISYLEKQLLEMELKIVLKNQEMVALKNIIQRLQQKIAQQAALLKQFNVQDFDMIPGQTLGSVSKDEKPRVLKVLRKQRIRIDSCNSVTISFKEQRIQSQSLSPKTAGNLNSNQLLLASENYLIKNKTEWVSPQSRHTEGSINRQYSSTNEQFKNLMMERGISLQMKSKDGTEQRSDIRHYQKYKKYKGSLKKVVAL